MKKLLYIAPHLSTGGLPQFLTKKIQLLKDQYDLHIIEYDDHTGGVLVVQKERIQEVISPEKFFVLGEDKMEVIDVIKKVKPDIIHLEEIPEMFMKNEVAEWIYRKDRDYLVVETSHDSSFNVEEKRFFPDKFFFISLWHFHQYKKLDIDKALVEYPLEFKDRPDRTKALEKLGLDPNKKHVLHVGLYTPRKNQKEFFEYARALKDYNIEFHSVGNQAGNFAFYWEPLMENKPENVTWWNERKDVDNFYSAMDLFLFTSRGTDKDKETMPLVIREALSWNMPQLLYNLPVYQSYWDHFDTIDYLKFNDFNKNCELIVKNLGLKRENINKDEEVVIISTFPNMTSVENVTLDCIKAAKKTGRKVILTSHIPVSDKLSKAVDYVVEDNNNILTYHTFYKRSTLNNEEFNCQVFLDGEGNDIYHGPACYTNYYNGAVMADKLGFKKAFYINYDYILRDDAYFDYISRVLDDKDAYYGKLDDAAEGPGLYTFFMANRPKFLLDVIPQISNAQEYDNLVKEWGAEANTYENLWYHGFKNHFNSIYTENSITFNKKIEEYFIHEDYSRVEYNTVLPSNIENVIVPYVQISNNTDSRILNITIIKDGKEKVYEHNMLVEGKSTFYKLIQIDKEDINLSVVFTSVDKQDKNKIINQKIIDINKDYIDNQIEKNGYFEYLGDFEETKKKNSSAPKIKIIQLVTDPLNNEKELRSHFSLTDFADSFENIEVQQLKNKIYTDIPPSENCNRPEDISDKPGNFKLSPGHYGCYLAHKNGTTLEGNENYDLVLVFEGDTIIDHNYQELYDNLLRWNNLCLEHDLDVVGFGNVDYGHKQKIEDLLINVHTFAPAQSYLIPGGKIGKFRDMHSNCKWDAADLWLTRVADFKTAIATTIYTKHLAGFSIVDQKHKSKDNDVSQIFKD